MRPCNEFRDQHRGEGKEEGGRSVRHGRNADAKKGFVFFMNNKENDARSHHRDEQRCSVYFFKETQRYALSLLVPCHEINFNYFIRHNNHMQMDLPLMQHAHACSVDDNVRYVMIYYCVLGSCNFFLISCRL